jgi:hypothetical protein
VYYYELHEGDEDLFSDLLLATDEEMDPDDFFELVQAIRRRVQDRYEDDTLIEAIAAELEREYGFIAIDDSRLTASVHVSVEEAGNYLTPIDEDDETQGADYHGVLVDFEAGDAGPTH